MAPVQARAPNIGLESASFSRVDGDLSRTMQSASLVAGTQVRVSEQITYSDYAIACGETGFVNKVLPSGDALIKFAGHLQPVTVIKRDFCKLVAFQALAPQPAGFVDHCSKDAMWTPEMLEVKVVLPLAELEAKLYSQKQLGANEVSLMLQITGLETKLAAQKEALLQQVSRLEASLALDREAQARSSSRVSQLEEALSSQRHLASAREAELLQQISQLGEDLDSQRTRMTAQMSELTTRACLERDRADRSASELELGRQLLAEADNSKRHVQESLQSRIAELEHMLVIPAGGSVRQLQAQSESLASQASWRRPSSPLKADRLATPSSQCIRLLPQGDMRTVSRSLSSSDLELPRRLGGGYSGGCSRSHWSGERHAAPRGVMLERR